MDRVEPLCHLATLGRYFVRHGLEQHAKALRHYYRAVQRRTATPPRYAVGTRNGTWDLDFIREWLALLRVPPFENVYQVRPRGTFCPTCGDRHGMYTAGVFPTGWKKQCHKDGAVWLVLEEEATATERSQGPPLPSPPNADALTASG